MAARRATAAWQTAWRQLQSGGKPKRKIIEMTAATGNQAKQLGQPGNGAVGCESSGELGVILWRLEESGEEGIAYCGGIANRRRE